MKVILAKPRGFCAGVVRAIEIVERALDKYGPPVYVRHEIVHNKWVVDVLGVARFTKSFPKSRLTQLRSQRAWRAKKVQEEATERGPGPQRNLPAGVESARPGRHYRARRTVILIGHVGHPVEGTLTNSRPVILVQTEADASGLTRLKTR